MHRHLATTSCVLIITTLVVLLAASQVVARGVAPRRQESGVGAPQVRQLWRTQVSSYASSAPYFDPATNLVYANNKGNLSVLDGTTGVVTKSASTSSLWGNSDAIPVGNTMVCANEYKYATCRDKTTLALEWKAQLTNFDIGTTQLYVGRKNAIYVTICCASHPDTKMFKLNATSGNSEVSAQLPGSQIHYQRPSFSEKQNLVFTGVTSFINALNADTLSLVWKYPTNSDVQTSGVFSQDESIVYFSSSAETVYALGTATGKLVWSVINAGGTNSPSFYNGVLYVGSQPGCTAFNGETGKKIWHVTTPDISEGYSHIYGDTVLFPTNQGITAVALNGSGVAWNWAGASNEVLNFPAPTSDGKLFLSDLSGTVYGLQLPPSGNSNGGVAEKRCLDSVCSSQCQVADYPVGKCVQTGATTSVLRTCSGDGTKLYAKSFPLSSACDLSSSHTDSEYQVAKCYTEAIGGSFEVTKCNA